MKKLCNLMTAFGAVLLFCTACSSDVLMPFDSVVRFTFVSFGMIFAGLFGNEILKDMKEKRRRKR